VIRDPGSLQLRVSVPPRPRHNGVVPRARVDFADDDVLLGALRLGDEEAFGWLLEQYSGPLLHLARTYVSDGEAAREVVQETWLAVLTGVDRFEQRSSLKTWLYQILINLARSKGVREHRSVPVGSLGSEVSDDEPAVDPRRFRRARERWPGHWASPPVAWDGEPEDRVLAGETVSVVAAAVQQLPANQQTVIVLRDVRGWNPDEVCQALEISAANQRVLLHRARSKVRQAVEAHFAERT
jgi:RNA polymerase sigma-70 factor (ECF subfamily)